MPVKITRSATMLPPTSDPVALGFDPARLARIDRHFAGYVDDGKLAGWQIVVSRRGEVAHASTYGLRDKESGAPVRDDTLWRIYSMSKPITSVAAMSLWEEGRFELTDEISRYLPEFADVRVYQKGSANAPFTEPAIEPIRIWHLLTHTSGLTYGFLYTSVVDELYRRAGFASAPDCDLATGVARLAQLPLLYQPGTAWGYSVATDVLGRVLEVVAGQPLDQVIEERVLAPLRMTDTGWWVEPDRADRLAALYTPHPATGQAVRSDAVGQGALAKPAFLSGGGGLICTAADYHRFCQMLLRGGELDGVRVLSNRTLGYMTRNHLPGRRDLAQLSTGGFAETILDGIGFGLGFAVVIDPVPAKTLSTPGQFYWGGLASTAFWVDPAEELTALLFTQLAPSSTYPLRPQLRQLVYSALVD
jgi:CubicO group peptidase (beta-lactamase class C family)